MMTILTESRWNTFYDCACLIKYCGLLPHTSLWESLLFGICLHIHDQHIDGKLHSYDVFEMDPLELGLHLFFSLSCWCLEDTQESSLKLLQEILSFRSERACSISTVLYVWYQHWNMNIIEYAQLCRNRFSTTDDDPHFCFDPISGSSELGVWCFTIGG
jgi:hypothetical protein